MNIKSLVLVGGLAFATLSTTPVMAAEKIQLSLGGFMRQYVGLTKSDEVASTNGSARDKSISQWTDAEIHFDGLTTLDNGVNVGVVVQLNADSGSTNNTNLSYLTVGSDRIGQLSLGAVKHAADDTLVRVPNASQFDWGDTDVWAGVADSATSASTAFSPSAGDITNVGDDRAAKMKFNSLTYNGFSGAISYSAAEGANTSDGRRIAGSNSEAATMGVNYVQQYANHDVAADITHMTFSTGSTSHDVNHVGLSIARDGFTGAIGYSDFNDGTTANALDGNALEFGLAYETGNYTFSGAYMTAENNGTATAGKNQDNKWQLAATYDLGAGVALSTTYFNSKADPEGTGTTVATGKSTSVSGLLAGIEVAF